MELNELCFNVAESLLVAFLLSVVVFYSVEPADLTRQCYKVILLFYVSPIAGSLLFIWWLIILYKYFHIKFWELNHQFLLQEMQGQCDLLVNELNEQRSLAEQQQNNIGALEVKVSLRALVSLSIALSLT